MVSEVVELRGHVIDSLLLPKVLDEITARDGHFELEELRIGKRGRGSEDEASNNRRTVDIGQSHEELLVAPA